MIVGCSKNEPQEVKEPTEPAVLKIGVDPTFAPFESVDSVTSQIVGFDIELIDEICSINNWKYELVPTSFDEILNNLRMNKLDMVISAVTITPEREVDLLFSDPYYQSGQILAVLNSDSSTNSLDDLAGLRVGVQLGTTGETMAKKIDGAQVYSFTTIDSAFTELAINELDAVLNDHSSTLNEIARFDNMKLIDEIVSSESYGIAFNKNNAELHTLVNKALRLIKADDRYQKMLAKWFDQSHQVNRISSDTL